MAGVTAAGFDRLLVESILAQIEAKQRALMGADIDLSPDSPLGQVNGIVAEAIGEVWEALEDVYNSAFPSRAFGRALDDLCHITGTYRRAATYSTADVVVNVDPGTYAAGSLVAVHSADPSVRFYNREAVTNSGGAAADVAAVFIAEVAGPVYAPAGSLIIGEPATGWNTLTHATDATPGEAEETDAALRARRALEASGLGAGNADAIAAAISKLAGVSGVRVLKNDTDAPDANGVPAHAIEAIVWGPESPTAADNLAVAEAIAAEKTDGIQATGTTTVTVEDSQGNETLIGFTRPAEVDIWVVLTIRINPDTYAGDDAAKAAILTYGDTLNPGEDAVFFQVAARLLGVSGVEDLALVPGDGIGLTAGTCSVANIPIGIREIAILDSSRIVITTVTV